MEKFVTGKTTHLGLHLERKKLESMNMCLFSNTNEALTLNGHRGGGFVTGTGKVNKKKAEHRRGSGVFDGVEECTRCFSQSQKKESDAERKRFF